MLKTNTDLMRAQGSAPKSQPHSSWSLPPGQAYEATREERMSIYKRAGRTPETTTVAQRAATSDTSSSFTAPSARNPVVPVREAAGACIASEAGRQTFQRVCLVVVHALVAGEVDASCRRHEIEGLTEAAARQRALELLDLVFEFDALDAARPGGA